jgi:hypothetical protein
LAGHVARIGHMRDAYKILVGKPGGNIPLGGPRHGRKGNIRRDRGEMGWEVVDRVHLAQGGDQL